MAKAAIDYKIKFSKRKTIAIHILPDSSVEVRAPYLTSKLKINSFIKQKIDWIETHQDNIKKFSPTKTNRDYINGEEFKFLGKIYKLKIERHIRNNINIVDDFLLVQTTKIEKSHIKNLINSWYTNIASSIFKEHMQQCLKIAKLINVSYDKEIKIKKMRSRWGSCNHKGEITLNLKLIYASEFCINYVILHELCHLREFNHSKKFYSLMGKVMPNWKQAKQELNKVIEIRLDL